MRRRLTGSCARRLSAGSYVKDGLLLLFDGIERGDAAGKWTDLVSGQEVALSRGQSFDADSLVCDGSEDVTPTRVNTWFGPVDETTAEVCFVCDADAAARPMYVVCFSGNVPPFGYLCVSSVERGYIKPGTFTFGYERQGLPHGRPSFASGELMSVSRTWKVGEEAGLVKNGVAVEGFSGSNGAGITFGIFCIGGRSNDKGLMKGRINCIRLYNRALTPGEVAANYAIDAARFGIGDGA